MIVKISEKTSDNIDSIRGHRHIVLCADDGYELRYLEFDMVKALAEFYNANKETIDKEVE